MRQRSSPHQPRGPNGWRSGHPIDWQSVFAAAVIAGGMVAVAFLATWYFQ